MGSTLLSEHPTAMHDLQRMEKALSALGQDLAPTWTLSGMQSPQVINIYG